MRDTSPAKQHNGDINMVCDKERHAILTFYFSLFTDLFSTTWAFDVFKAHGIAVL